MILMTAIITIVVLLHGEGNYLLGMGLLALYCWFALSYFDEEYPDVDTVVVLAIKQVMRYNKTAEPVNATSNLSAPEFPGHVHGYPLQDLNASLWDNFSWPALPPAAPAGSPPLVPGQG